MPILLEKRNIRIMTKRNSGQYEELFGKGLKEIDFETVSNVAVGEIQQVIQQIILCHEMKMNYDLSDKKSDVVYIHRSF